MRPAEPPTSTEASEPLVTGIRTTRRDGRAIVSAGGGALRAQRLPAEPGTASLALLAGQMLLLGGDRVRIEIVVEAGVTLRLRDIAATVAHRSDHALSRWDVDIALAEGATLLWDALPFVVAEGAVVGRDTRVEMADGARLGLRECLVLGRSGEFGGRIDSRTRIAVGGQPVLWEEQSLDADRGLPGLLGPHRVVDTRYDLGLPAPVLLDRRGLLQVPLLDDAGTLTRWLGADTASSPLP